MKFAQIYRDVVSTIVNNREVYRPVTHVEACYLAKIIDDKVSLKIEPEGVDYMATLTFSDGSETSYGLGWHELENISK